MFSNKMIVTFMLIAIATLACAGCSDDNPVIPVNPVDTAPPVVPANLSVDYTTNKAVINWEENTVDTDLAGYIVTRENGSVTDVLVDTPIRECSFEDERPPVGVNQYHVFAVDLAGNESAVATVGLTILLDSKTPEMTH